MNIDKEVILESFDVQVKENLEEKRQHGEEFFMLATYPVVFTNDTHTSIRWHWHKEFEFMYITEGKALFKVAKDTFVLEKGDALFINLNTLHAVEAIPGETCTYYSIVFHPWMISPSPNASTAIKYVLPVSRSQNLSHVVLTHEYEFHSQMLEDMQTIIYLLHDKPYCWELLCEQNLLHLWTLFLQQITKNWDKLKTRSIQQSLDETRAKDAISYIQQHYASNITLGDIAASIHVSESECCRAFKRCINLSPIEYLMRYRVYMSTILIRDNPTLSFSAIALQSGFNSSSYYNKLFRKYVGCTPSQFRKNPLLYTQVADHFGVPFT